MRLLEAQQRCLEDAAGTAAGTVSANIAYTPSHIPAVHAELTKLSRKKKHWGITIEESLEGRTLIFEESLRIYVPLSLWENFVRQIFGSMDLKEKMFTADLESYLAEAFKDEVERAKSILRQQVITSLNDPLLANQRHKLAELQRLSGDRHLRLSPQGQVVFPEPTVAEQLKAFLEFIDKAYQDDIGQIQLLAEAFHQRQPLTALPLFTNYDNIIGNYLAGDFRGIPFIYTASVNLNWEAEEMLRIDDVPMVGRMKINPLFREEKGILYPASEEGFPSNLGDLLLRYAEGGI